MGWWRALACLCSVAVMRSAASAWWQTRLGWWCGGCWLPKAPAPRVLATPSNAGGENIIVSVSLLA
jgi:hypothetical protein